MTEQLRVSDVLSSKGLDVRASRIYLVRHKDPKRYQLAKYIGTSPLLQYQASQRPRDSFEPGSIVVSFFGNRGGYAVLLGVHCVEKQMPIEEAEAQGLLEGSFEPYDPSKPGCFHVFKELPQFEDLLLRLEIVWTGGEINWRRELGISNDFSVAGHVDASLPFTSIRDVSLVMSQLRRVIIDPRWQAELSATQAVYVIADEQTGDQYVGSACGAAGLYQRWATYAANGHGHNHALVELLGVSAHRVNDLRFSVVEAFPLSAPPGEIRNRENFWKRALITRQHGYNRN